MQNLLYIWKEGRFFARYCFWEKNPGVFKSNKVVPSQEYCGSLSLNYTFGQNQNLSNFLSGAFQKRYFGFKFNFSFYSMASADSALSTLMTYQVEKSERQFTENPFNVCMSFGEVLQMLRVPSLKILRVSYLKSLRKV